jgi:hypothetical protein
VSGRQRDNPFPLGQHADAHVQRASPTLDERCTFGGKPENICSV